jgi:predicted NACHT family NTPase
LLDYILSILNVVIKIPDSHRKPDAARKYKIDALSAFLERAHCYVFLDGIDECSAAILQSVMRDIETIAQTCDQLGQSSESSTRPQARILCTCRTGFTVSLPNGFSALQIQPLNEQDRWAIVSKWARDPEKTLETISKSHLSRIIDRPLFLVQVIILFDWHGYIPDRPSDIYKRLIVLIMELWDHQKGASDVVIRKSRYEKFTPNYKLEFLGQLAYWLVDRGKMGAFSYEDFREFFSGVHVKYDLPGYEVDKVLNEIEAHTGFIVEASYGTLPPIIFRPM